MCASVSGASVGAATVMDAILTGRSSIPESNSPCTPRAFHLHILSLQLMQLVGVPRPGLSLAAPGICAPTPNSASVSPSPSPVSSLAPVLPAPKLAAVLARLFVRMMAERSGFAAPSFMPSNDVSNIDASPHGDCETYMCTATPGRSEHQSRVRVQSTVPSSFNVVVSPLRSPGWKMETPGFASAPSRPASQSRAISSYM